MVDTESPTVCPKCKKDDQIKKATAIIASDTHTVKGGSWQTQVYIDKKGKKQYEDDYVPYSGEQSSALAQSLRPPAKPGTGCTNTWGIILGGGLLVIGLPCLMCSLLGVGQSLIAIPQAIRNNVGGTDILLSSGFAILFSGIQIIIAVAMIILGIVIYRKLNQKHTERLAQYNEIELPRWEKAMQRWNNLYYCFRDDCVFVPGSEDFSPIAEMRDFLYRE
jgi:hypothetical protein